MYESVFSDEFKKQLSRLEKKEKKPAYLLGLFFSAFKHSPLNNINLKKGFLFSNKIIQHQKQILRFQ